MKNYRPFLIAAVFALAACGEAGQGLTEAAGDFANEAAKAAGVAADTKTVCMLAGQNETFCGCMQDELGAELDPAHLEGLREVVAGTLGQPSAGGDPETREAMIACAARGAVAGTMGEASEGGEAEAP